MAHNVKTFKLTRQIKKLLT